MLDSKEQNMNQFKNIVLLDRCNCTHSDSFFYFLTYFFDTEDVEIYLFVHQ